MDPLSSDACVAPRSGSEGLILFKGVGSQSSAITAVLLRENPPQFELESHSPVGTRLTRSH